jgi:hypothetical protein
MTAQRLKLPLLVLHATGSRAAGKMQDLAKFLGKEVGPEVPYPHVKTPSAHWAAYDVMPPADEPDPNEDLWGDWNGGVPTGSHEWAKDLKLTSNPNRKKTGAVSSATKASAMNEDELCPGHPHILRSSSTCSEKNDP